MSRGERYSLGLALVSTALSGLLKKEFWLYLVFFVGLGFWFLPPIYGWIMTKMFGSKRPSFAEIESMSSEQYKPLVVNLRSRRWIRALDWWNGYD